MASLRDAWFKRPSLLLRSLCVYNRLMAQLFFNPWLLFGLLGVALPVIAHLLSKRKFDVVEWGAMQFLNPSRKTRRRIRLEELLLLLVRIVAIALIALALARPWLPSGFLLGYRSMGSRDVVLVIDGSNSMGRSDGLSTLHQKAVRRAKEFLGTLTTSDTVTVIDARDEPFRHVDATNDFDFVARQLDELSDAAGAGNLQDACEDAVRILGRTSNESREVVVFTDRQRVGWSPESDAKWTRFDESMKFPAVRPHVWVVDLSQGLASGTANISVGRVELSRDLTVPNSPVTVRATIRNSGSKSAFVPVHLLVDGQRLAGYDGETTIPANGETTYSRPIRFTDEGTHVLTVRAATARDSIPADNENSSAINVAGAIPVLMLEPKRSLTPADRHGFFAELALTTPQNDSPWVLCRSVYIGDVTAEDFGNVAAVILPDVGSMKPELIEQVVRFARAGGGVMVALGPDTTLLDFDPLVELGLLPELGLGGIGSSPASSDVPVTVAPYSLESPWLARFREKERASLFSATFTGWRLVDVATPATAGQGGRAASSDDEASGSGVSPAIVTAKLTGGQPWLIESRCGRGQVLLMTSTLNSRWNSLPSQGDFVTLLHEAVFHLVASPVKRNLRVGESLAVRLALDSKAAADAKSLRFVDPFKDEVETESSAGDEQVLVTSLPARIPGAYQLQFGEANQGPAVDRFVVDYDHAEDDPAELTADDRARLQSNDRLAFATDVDDLSQKMYGDETRSEIWHWLLWAFLGLLTLEVWMTRRLVLNGHVDV